MQALLQLVVALLASSFAQGTRIDSASMAAEIVKAGSVVLDGVSFVDATAQLRPESSAVLNEVVALLASHDEWRFEVQGHMGGGGAPEASLATSEARAQAVVAWLTQHGVAPSRLVARGYGGTKPVATNATADGRAKNQRIQLKKLNEE